MPPITPVFALPDRLATKAVPELIAADEQHFSALAAVLRESVADVSERLDELRRRPGGGGEAALERDLEIHRLTARLRTLRRYSLDLCLGRMTPEGDGDPIYIGRISMVDAAGRRLLIDWRAPAAAPFFAATRADALGLAARRRYRWVRGRVTDYWDEAFTPAGASRAALDDESAFIASLGASRSPRMRDVLATIQSDQDAIIRADARGALVVDGGPGTGKTVVALHRAAFLLYSDPRISRDGVLVVGPSPEYLGYVSDVLPSLGEDGVHSCTLRDLVPGGAGVADETDARVAELKASARLVAAIEAAVRRYERPPTRELVLDTGLGQLVVDEDVWAEAFDAVEPGTAHNEARAQIRDQLYEILADRIDDEDVAPVLVRRLLAHDDELADVLAEAWPLLDPAGLVAELWSSPAILRACAPWLGGDDVTLLQRGDATAWTVADLPFLDAARRRVGDPQAVRRARARDQALAARQEQLDRVIDDLIAADDSELRLTTMLRGQDAQNSLIDEAELPTVTPDELAGPFAHLIVDEAQELTDAEWAMLLARCPSRSVTVVGDRAQARRGFPETWQERLQRVGFGAVRVATLGVNYRTPEEIMTVAEPMIRQALPDANVPTAVRSAGRPVLYGSASDLDAVIAEWLDAAPDEGIACVIGAPDFTGTARVRSLSPEQSKGLEFDFVVLVDPDAFGGGLQGAVDRYVAMTRATQRLAVLVPDRDRVRSGEPQAAT